jgi:hypothetical protein
LIRSTKSTFGGAGGGSVGFDVDDGLITNGINAKTKIMAAKKLIKSKVIQRKLIKSAMQNLETII